MTSIHSLIRKDPINYKEFALSNKCKFLYIELCKNEYLFIPKGWHHWIESDPYTLAFSYTVEFLNITPSAIHDNKLISCINKNIPFCNKHNEDKYNINYDDFINNSDNITHIVEISKHKYLGRIIVPYIESTISLTTNNIKNIFQDKKNVDKYLYVSDASMNNVYSNYDKIPNFNNILNDCTLINSHYKNSLWFNFDKNVNSGLHRDYDNNILYVICGKKKVLLTSPYYKNCVYEINIKLSNTNIIN
jgi:hypothetical protein